MATNSGRHHSDLLDALTSHLSLYHSRNPNSSTNSASSAPRAAILRWFSSLPAPSRRAAATVVDAGLASVLLSMLRRLRLHGHGFFFLLPDLPSTSTSSSPPSLLFRRSRGLLARAAAASAAELAVGSNLLLFSASESGHHRLDAITVTEAFVTDLDMFVSTMDEISGGKFLRGSEDEAVAAVAAWPELTWLKDKGYYSLEAFVVNRIEVAIRVAWMASGGNAGGGKKGRKAGKEKVAATSGVAANALWRMSGCVDWWGRLDRREKNQVVDMFVGKAVKSLVILMSILLL